MKSGNHIDSNTTFNWTFGRKGDSFLYNWFKFVLNFGYIFLFGFSIKREINRINELNTSNSIFKQKTDYRINYFEYWFCYGKPFKSRPNHFNYFECPGAQIYTI